MKPEQAEIVRLKREVTRLKAERVKRLSGKLTLFVLPLAGHFP
jgi:hypothetical protein